MAMKQVSWQCQASRSLFTLRSISRYPSFEGEIQGHAGKCMQRAGMRDHARLGYEVDIELAPFCLAFDEQPDAAIEAILAAAEDLRPAACETIARADRRGVDGALRMRPIANHARPDVRRPLTRPAKVAIERGEIHTMRDLQRLQPRRE